MPEFNLIIDLPASRQAGQIRFWGVAETVTTPDPAQAMLVPTEHLNKCLHRYDNGRTTRAVLQNKIKEMNGDYDQLIQHELKEQAA
ncbi:MAG: hypothetical protein ACRBB6_02930 [Neptuniibacter sp.]